MKTQKILYGFTLIELLVVISIIGILAALAIFGMQSAFKNSRNTQRKSDLRQYQSSLENYANANNGLYFARTSATGIAASNLSGAGTNLCSDLTLSNCPEDPSWTTSGQPIYRYQSDGTGGTPNATKYLLWATLETTPVKYWIVCSTGKSGEQPNTWTPPGSPNTGTCPL